MLHLLVRRPSRDSNARRRPSPLLAVTTNAAPLPPAIKALVDAGADIVRALGRRVAREVG